MREIIMKNKIILIPIVLSVLFTGCLEGEAGEGKSKYSFSVGEVVLSIGDNADLAIQRLGRCNFSSSAPSCAGVGEDEIYVYNGFKLFAHRDGENAEIVSIELTNDTVSTAEGIEIGDRAECLLEVYGEGRSIGDAVEYNGDGCKLRFTIRDGKIKFIKYYR